jgi:hypothetical protein
MTRFLVTAGLLVILIVFMSTEGSAQFRDQDQGSPRAASSMLSGGGSSMFGFFNPESFNMSHTYTMSYTGMGGRGMAVGMYTNSMFYQISNPLDVQLDVSMMHSPYNSFSQTSNDFSGVFISRAALNYQPSDNFRIQVQYMQMPYSGYGYGSSFYNPWYHRFGY